MFGHRKCELVRYLAGKLQEVLLMLVTVLGFARSLQRNLTCHLCTHLRLELLEKIVIDELREGIIDSRVV